MAIARTTRNSEPTHELREDTSREETWSPPALLDAPPAREGMRQRWVSTQILGQDIPHHTMKRFREGWSPRPVDTVPKDFPVPTIAQGQWEGHIGVEGMILCEMPETKVEARKRYFARKNADQNQFVESNLNKVERSGGVSIDRDFRSDVSRGQKIVDD
jgi:hypothetical protein